MSTPLQQSIQQYISENGNMPLDKYMETCLYDAEHGYYMTNDPFGEAGDFTTAPEITQLFGEMIAAWVADTWIKMGKPTNWTLVECGAGRGTLMSDMLRTLKAALPEAYDSAKVAIVEISPHLKDMQRSLLKDHTNVRWFSDITEVDNNSTIIMVANELLDAFPVKQFTKQNGAFHERLVTLNNGELSLTTSEAPSELEIQTDALTLETSPSMESFLCKTKDVIKDGVALFIDYGAQGYGDTLQAVKSHQTVNIFNTPGQADLTAHVNFDAVREVLGQENTSETEAMGTFLTDIGLPMRAAVLHEKSDDAGTAEIESATHRLLHPEQMGTLFKVMAYRTNPDWDIAALAFQPHVTQ